MVMPSNKEVKYAPAHPGSLRAGCKGEDAVGAGVEACVFVKEFNISYHNRDL